MGLKDYRAKRNFATTPEPAVKPVPSAKRRSGSGRIFVVQKHDATNLHYDLRLQVGDALVSWAVPKGPSFDPRDKRLAVHVEDHPLEYAGFEGVIPEGYGAGTVMIWDRGQWSSDSGDPAKALRDGMLKFRMEGERLKGRWMLVRTRTAAKAKQEHWLLVKERDDQAAATALAEAFTTSVASGRTMAEIAEGKKGRSRASDVNKGPAASALRGARAAPMPKSMRPQLAAPATEAPAGDEWLHETKFDGYRLLAFCRGDQEVRLISRTGKDWSSKFPQLTAVMAERVRVDAVLDGEAVVLDPRGVSDFQALQNAISGRRGAAIAYIAFDLPWCDGHDLSPCTLEDRKALLASLIGTRQEGRLRYSEHLVGNGPAAFGQARVHGLEGIVSKKRSAAYTQTRSPSWLKVKCFFQQEFVVGGFTPPEGSRDQFGALVVGYHDEAGKLIYAGRVGTGFSSETLKRLSARMLPLVRTTKPFSSIPADPELRAATWIKPELVAQVQFREWTRDGTLRFPSFRGLREDIEAKSVVREETPAASGSRAPMAPPHPVQPTAQPSAGASVRLTHPDRVVYPDRGHVGGSGGITKAQIAAYYEAVAPLLLQHAAGRPLAIVRCPEGEGKKCFFQKHKAKGMPAAIGSVKLADEQGHTEEHLVINDAEGLLGLVQMNALEIHTWSAKADQPERPDRLVFDLDPGDGVTWAQVTAGALLVREALSQMKLTGFVRTTGGKGIHVVVPIQPRYDWDQTKQFSKAVADTLARLFPTRFVAVSGAGRRKGRIYIDYLRNARGATAIASYSTRARPGATVALPISWSELESGVDPSAFNVLSVPRLLAARRTDPWSGMDAKSGAIG